MGGGIVTQIESFLSEPALRVFDRGAQDSSQIIFGERFQLENLAA